MSEQTPVVMRRIRAILICADRRSSHGHQHTCTNDYHAHTNRVTCQPELVSLRLSTLIAALTVRHTHVTSRAATRLLPAIDGGDDDDDQRTSANSYSTGSNDYLQGTLRTQKQRRSHNISTTATGPAQQRRHRRRIIIIIISLIDLNPIEQTLSSTNGRMGWLLVFLLWCVCDVSQK